MIAPETRHVEIGSGALPRTAGLFRAHYGDSAAVIVADPRTYPAAGEAVADALRDARQPLAEPILLTDPGLYAEYGYFEELLAALASREATPLAVGSGTINDLTKLAAYRLGRPYVAVATAASMDGYAAFGASITYQGSKQTFDCPAPEVVIADLDVLRAAPPELNAAGYADLLAKVTAGADWLLADALGEEPLDPAAWRLVQDPLRHTLADPAGVRAGRVDAVRRLTEGLLAGGMAMQHSRTSRPASGAEHQFSHLWDMQNHRHNGAAPAHGFKVGVATLAVTRLYERLLAEPLEALDLDAACSAWPAHEDVERRITALFGETPLGRKALEETRAKWVSPDALRRQLERLREVWPELRTRLREQLLPSAGIERMLREVGAPTQPEEIGIRPERLRESFEQAYYIRRRFTVLDLAVRIGLLNAAGGPE